MIKKLFFKFKARSNNQNILHYTEITDSLYENNNKNEASEKLKKKKPRVKSLNKSPGFISEDHKFKVMNDEKSPCLIEENVENKKTLIDGISNSINFNADLNDKRELVDEINLKSVIKKAYSKSNPPLETKKKNIYLTDFERNSLYAFMGLVSESSIKFKEESIYSVEYLFGKKLYNLEYKYKEKIIETDKLNNSNLVLKCKKYNQHFK